MQKGLTELCFILDRSGSMAGLEKDTIGGFNSMIDRQKAENGEALVSTVIFDNVSETLHDRLPLQEVRKLTGKEYYVRGCTALYDAVGSAISHIRHVHGALPETAVPEKTLFVIMTDGMENASREYSGAKVKAMIERAKKAGWEFLFLGANIDAVKTAAGFGINANRAVNYECDEKGTQLNYQVLNATVSRYRSAPSGAAASACLDADWAEEIKADYKKRHKE